MLTVMPLKKWYNWTYFYDPVTLAKNIILVLVMLLMTGNVKAFFRSFRLMRKTEVDMNKLFSSLHPTHFTGGFCVGYHAKMPFGLR